MRRGLAVMPLLLLAMAAAPAQAEFRLEVLGSPKEPILPETGIVALAFLVRQRPPPSPS